MKTCNLPRLSRHILHTLVLIMFACPVWAQSFEPDEAQQKQVAEQIAETKERLQLTDDQAEVVEEILRNSMGERITLMEKYGLNPNDPNFKRPGMRTMRKMRKEMEQLGDKTKKQLAIHLSDEQMNTWEALEKERRDRMRAQMRSRG